MTHKKNARALTAIAAIVLALVVFFALQRDAPVDRPEAFPRGEIVIGIDASYPPFAIDEGGILTGLDIDVAEAIATEIGLPARFVNIGYYGLYDALISGKVDLLISALRVEPSRMADVLYTRHYFDNGLVLVFGSGLGRADLEAIDGMSVAYEYASGSDAQVRTWEDEGRLVERRPYEQPEYALDALRLSLADAALVDAITYLLYQNEHDAFKGDFVFVTQEYYALAVRADRVESFKVVDGALAALKESGDIARLIDKWF